MSVVTRTGGRSLACALLLITSACTAWDAIAARREFARAEQAWRRQDFTTAVQLYEHVSAAYPDSPQAPEALYLAASTLHLSLNQPREAVPLYQRLTLTHGDSAYAAKAHQALGDIAQVVEGDMAAAITAYRAALVLERDSASAADLLYRVALAEVRVRQYDAARTDLATLLSRFPDSPLADEAAYTAAGSFLTEGRPADARAALEKFLTDFPQSELRPLAELDRAQTFADEGRLAEAVLEFEKLKPTTTRPRVVEAMLVTLRQRLTDETSRHVAGVQASP